MAVRNKRAESVLVERYKDSFFQDIAFKRGLGIAWPALRSAIVEEAMHSRMGNCAVAPLTVAQAAAVLNVAPRTMLGLARQYPFEEVLFMPPRGSLGLVRKGTVSPCRLLRWAAGVPGMREWRTRREDFWSLGATASSQEVADQVQEMENIPVSVQLLLSREVPEVVALLPDPAAIPIAVDDLFRWQEMQRAQDYSKSAVVSQTMTIPDALALPWHSQGLRRVWFERFRDTLKRLDYLLEHQSIESSRVLMRARKEIGFAALARRKIRAVIARAR
ncbi:hypothetical protein CR156_18465 [Stenotrophomonas lactitubi]|nr:hypothetical protein CR156_18465 [Stenotrophomonas lactitubi]